MRTNLRTSICVVALAAVAVALAALSSVAIGEAPAQALDKGSTTAAGANEFAAGDTAKIEDLAWFAGCWTMALPDGVIEEHWLAPAGGAMLGLSRTVRGGRLKEYEFLALRELDGRLAYVAIPSRQRETAFPLVRFKKNAAVFENTAHDFPQRIIYLKTDAGITAMIEGKVKGEMRSSEYVYSACK